MSAWPELTNHPAPSLQGREGELVSLCVSVPARELEEVLDVLSGLPFPVNPEIYHHSADRPATLVEFPAYASRVGEVRDALRFHGFPDGCLAVQPALCRRA